MNDLAEQLERWRQARAFSVSLLAACAEKDWLQLKVSRKSTPKNWSRVRVLPGAYGRCIGELSPGWFLIDIRTADWAPALRKSIADIDKFLTEMEPRDDAAEGEP